MHQSPMIFLKCQKQDVYCNVEGSGEIIPGSAPLSGSAQKFSVEIHLVIFV